MTQKIHFTKMHGAGNDYIYVDTTLYSLGRLLVSSVANRDYDVVQALVLYIGIVVIVLNGVIETLVQKGGENE